MTQTEPSTFDRIAAPYDRGMAPLEKLWLRQMRIQLLSHARGRVLEIGVGTGANLPFYPAPISLYAIDESADMLSVAARRAAVLDRCIHLSLGNAEHLAFSSDYFDTAITSLVLCSVVNQRRTLSEIRRVLRKPGGKLLLLEHMRPHSQPLASLVDLANIPWYAFNRRCHLNRRTLQAILQMGFSVEQVESKLGGFFRLIVVRTA